MKYRLKHLLQAPWFRLASTYLLIIMVMSIGFSVVFYRTSSHELGRQIPPHSVTNTAQPGDPGTVRGFTFQDNQTTTQPSELDKFFQERVEEGRSELLSRLIILNTSALVLGSALSYYLARRTLKPIEDAMEAQSQFVSDASHELRTPLTAIQATNDVALRDKKLNLAKAKSVIEANSEEAVKLQVLSDGLLNLARQDQAKLTMSPVNLQEAVSQALTRVVQPAQAKDISIDDQTPNLQLKAHEAAVTQLLVILLDNAIKYSPPKSTVYLEAHRKGKAGYINVRDEGIGIRASDLPHIFRRFYRADTVRGGGDQHGYGIGLSIAQKLAEQLDGIIQVQSEPGKGATFTVRLPLA